MAFLKFGTISESHPSQGQFEGCRHAKMAPAKAAPPPGDLGKPFDVLPVDVDTLLQSRIGG